MLDVRIKDLTIPEYEKTLDVRYDSKSIRLDLYAEDDEHTVYDVEMQVQDEAALPERSRYYHSVMDMEQLQKGESYEKLKNTYVIFIMKNGMGKGYDLPVYTYRYQCQEDQSRYLNDRTWTVIVNADCRDEGLSEEMKAFLYYVRNDHIPEGNNGLVSKIDEALREAKEHRKWRMEYMTFEEELRRQKNIWRKEALEEGKAIGLMEGRILQTIEIYRTEINLDDDAIVQRLMDRFSLSKSQAEQYVSDKTAAS